MHTGVRTPRHWCPAIFIQMALFTEQPPQCELHNSAVHIEGKHDNQAISIAGACQCNRSDPVESSNVNIPFPFNAVRDRLWWRTFKLEVPTKLPTDTSVNSVWHVGNFRSVTDLPASGDLKERMFFHRTSMLSFFPPQTYWLLFTSFNLASF